MHPSSRRYRPAAWIGTALCALIAIAWIASLVQEFSHASPQWTIGVRDGCLCIDYRSNARLMLVAQPAHHRGNSYGFRGPMFVSRPSLPVTMLTIPLWLPLLLALAPTCWLWRRTRRGSAVHCPCGYNLTGNTSGICPECGTRVPI